MWYFDFISLIAEIAVAVLYIVIITDIYEFQGNHVSPFALCKTLENLIWPIKICHILIVLESLLTFPYTLPVLIYNLLVAIYFFLETRTHHYFEPLNIVRDQNKKKMIFIALFVINIISFVYSFVFMLYSILNIYKVFK